jgi:HEPN domain-containing protein
MALDERDDALRWLRQASDDLTTARRLRELAIDYAACFFAQQAGEKALKAAAIARGLEPGRGHAVAELAAALERVGVIAAGTGRTVGVLDQYYIPTRYPDALPGSVASQVYGPTDSQRALDAAEVALETARRVVG